MKRCSICKGSEGPFDSRTRVCFSCMLDEAGIRKARRPVRKPKRGKP